jgi:hypothetical protein
MLNNCAPIEGPLDAAVLHPSWAAIENEHTMVIHLNTTPRRRNRRATASASG